METVTALGAPVNIGAPPVRGDPGRWVAQIQAKLHCWAATSPTVTLVESPVR